MTETKPSTSCGFPKSRHLRKTDEISSVFDFNCRVSGAYLQLIAKPNNFDYPRLAIIVSKKVVRQAVARNYIKRFIRERFRCQPQIDPLDMVIRVRQAFDKQQSVLIDSELTLHFKRIKKCLG